MSDEAGREAWLANIRAQFVGEGGGGYDTILKQRFPTFGTVITVADNQEADVEIDSD